MGRSEAAKWLIRAVAGLIVAAPLAWLVYLRPEGGYGAWGEAGLYFLAALTAAAALVVSEVILANLHMPRPAEEPAKLRRGTRVAAAQDLLRKGITPVPDAMGSLLAHQLRLVKAYLPGVLQVATIHPAAVVLDQVENDLRSMEERKGRLPTAEPLVWLSSSPTLLRAEKRASPALAVGGVETSQPPIPARKHRHPGARAPLWALSETVPRAPVTGRTAWAAGR